MEKLVVHQGKLEGKGLWGRAPRRWIDQVKKFTKTPFKKNQECFRQR